MPETIDLSPVLKSVTPEEAVAYFRQKGYRIGFDYRDVWQQEHQAAFTVAKALQLDLLQDIRVELDKALANGTTLAEFQKALIPKLQARGWWGRQEMVDPVDGEAKAVQLGSPRRLETIFDTNLATAYSEGQWERIQRNKELFPFLEYVRSASANPRHTHLAYAGLVLPVNDAFWQSHLPVKEWGCKCTVIQHTQRTLDREGLTVGKAPPEVMRTLVNKRTGETMTVPTGVDPAFHYPPGGRRANLGKMMMDKADASNAATAARVLSTDKAKWLPAVQTEFSEFVGRYAVGERREVGLRRVVGVLAPAVLDNLAQVGVEPQHATVAVHMDKLSHLLGDHRSEVRKTKGVGVDFVASLPTLLQHVGEAWIVRGTKRAILLCTAPDEVARVVKVVVDLDAVTKGAQPSNHVVSMELIDPRSFTRKGLTPLH